MNMYVPRSEGPRSQRADEGDRRPSKTGHIAPIHTDSAYRIGASSGPVTLR